MTNRPSKSCKSSQQINKYLQLWYLVLLLLPLVQIKIEKKTMKFGLLFSLTSAAVIPDIQFQKGTATTAGKRVANAEEIKIQNWAKPHR